MRRWLADKIFSFALWFLPPTQLNQVEYVTPVRPGFTVYEQDENGDWTQATVGQQQKTYTDWITGRHHV